VKGVLFRTEDADKAAVCNDETVEKRRSAGLSESTANALAVSFAEAKAFEC